MRVCQNAGNLGGTDQKALKTAAGITMAILEVLRTRADRTREEAAGDEVRALRAEQKKLQEETRKELEETRAALKEAQAAAEKARAIAEVERRKALIHLNLLEQATKVAEGWKAKLRRMEEEQRTWWANGPSNPHAPTLLEIGVRVAEQDEEGQAAMEVEEEATPPPPPRQPRRS